MKPRSPIVALCGVWVLCAVGGLFLLVQSRATAGDPGAPPVRWPDASSLARAPGHATLVMTAHPRCPCTRASLVELARLMTEVGDRVVAHVVFVRPAGAAADWEATDTFEAARRIPGVQVHLDPDSRESAQFGAMTSGQVVAFAADGKLIFSGGITGARGHEGENPGHTQLRELLLTGKAASLDSAVFGCPLHDAPPRT